MVAEMQPGPSKEVNKRSAVPRDDKMSETRKVALYGCYYSRRIECLSP